MKKRNKLFRNIIVCALSAAMVITSGDFYAAKPQHAAAADVIQALDYAIVENVADFRSYIDNDYPASSQDIIETDWSGDTPLYEINLPCPGTLLVAPISPEGYAKGTVYMDLAKTTPVFKADGCDSSRDEISSYTIAAGTYYYQASRWNGTNPLTISSFIGFIPAKSGGLRYTNVRPDFTITTDVTVPVISKKEDLTSAVNAEASITTDTITTDWKGYSNVHSFVVEESGWLLAMPLCENDYITWELFSDTAITSRIFKGKTLQSTQDTMYSCYLTPGTYYYRGNRWNGTNSLFFTTYLGFIPDAPRFSVTSNTLNADASGANVTFQGEAGTIRVMEGDYDPSIVMSDTFWNTSNRVNVINGTSTTIKKNGKYVARLETADGLYVMVPFTVSGVIEKVVVIPTATPVPTQTPASTRTPVTTPTPGKTTAPSTTATPAKKVYKITVAKKKLKIKVKKSKKIKYTITKGYVGLVRLKTSNPKVATVNSKGVVTAKKKGKCKITLSLSNGKKVVVQITVKK